jgi:hypothetical protein
VFWRARSQFADLAIRGTPGRQVSLSFTLPRA